MAHDIFEEIARLRRDEEPAALATVVDTAGSTPGKLGSRMVVRADGRIVGTIGGGCVEADVIRTALDVLDTGLSKKMNFTLAGEEAERTGLACGGKLEVMIESLNEPHAFVIGCGHVGQRIAALAKEVGFRVTALDDRPDYASKERFPSSDDVVCADFADLATTLRVGPSGFIVVATRGHQYDYDGLRWALETPARFIGVIGSKSKRVQFFRKLRDEGVPDEAFENVQIPVGLAIGAETPEEIAVSVVGAMIARRHGRE